ncbi:hypothetical protein [Halomontanus rarus]|nr:hypothetical protein [Halovivax sp. TS33]
MTDHTAFDGPIVVEDERVPADPVPADRQIATRLEAAMEVTG